MQRAPNHPSEAQRIAELLRFDVLDSEDEKAFDELTELASHICQTPISLISLIDTDRQWFKSRVGIDAQETPREQAF
ncbi:MAG: histidine kinase, partial [Bermanella sp.]